MLYSRGSSQWEWLTVCVCHNSFTIITATSLWGKLFCTSYKMNKSGGFLSFDTGEWWAHLLSWSTLWNQSSEENRLQCYQTLKKLPGREHDVDKKGKSWNFWSSRIGPIMVGQAMGTLRNKRQSGAMRTCRGGKERRWLLIRIWTGAERKGGPPCGLTSYFLQSKKLLFCLCSLFTLVPTCPPTIFFPYWLDFLLLYPSTENILNFDSRNPKTASW